MSFEINFSELRRRFLGSWVKRRDRVLRTLCARYIDERQHAARFRQHAEAMHYAQHRAALHRIATDELDHAELIAHKIRELGGSVPEVPVIAARARNPWGYLVEDLEEERRCGAELEQEILGLGRNYGDVADVLRRIEQDERKHRDEIREMMMRSDPQAA
ncbi:MAG TPA: ferritin-like domain-containing protein [Candidatus Binatia bacterium]|jgi:rubrerythrin